MKRFKKLLSGILSASLAFSMVAGVSITTKAATPTSSIATPSASIADSFRTTGKVPIGFDGTLLSDQLANSGAANYLTLTGTAGGDFNTALWSIVTAPNGVAITGAGVSSPTLTLEIPAGTSAGALEVKYLVSDTSNPYNVITVEKAYRIMIQPAIAKVVALDTKGKEVAAIATSSAVDVAKYRFIVTDPFGNDVTAQFGITSFAAEFDFGNVSGTSVAMPVAIADSNAGPFKVKILSGTSVNYDVTSVWSTTLTAGTTVYDTYDAPTVNYIIGSRYIEIKIPADTKRNVDTTFSIASDPDNSGKIGAVAVSGSSATTLYYAVKPGFEKLYDNLSVTGQAAAYSDALSRYIFDYTTNGSLAGANVSKTARQLGNAHVNIVASNVPGTVSGGAILTVPTYRGSGVNSSVQVDAAPETGFAGIEKGDKITASILYKANDFAPVLLGKRDFVTLTNNKVVINNIKFPKAPISGSALTITVKRAVTASAGASITLSPTLGSIPETVNVIVFPIEDSSAAQFSKKSPKLAPTAVVLTPNLSGPAVTFKATTIPTNSIIKIYQDSNTGFNNANLIAQLTQHATATTIKFAASGAGVSASAVNTSTKVQTVRMEDGYTPLTAWTTGKIWVTYKHPDTTTYNLESDPTLVTFKTTFGTSATPKLEISQVSGAAAEFKVTLADKAIKSSNVRFFVEKLNTATKKSAYERIGLYEDTAGTTEADITFPAPTVASAPNMVTFSAINLAAISGTPIYFVGNNTTLSDVCFASAAALEVGQTYRITASVQQDGMLESARTGPVIFKAVADLESSTVVPQPLYVAGTKEKYLVTNNVGTSDKVIVGEMPAGYTVMLVDGKKFDSADKIVTASGSIDVVSPIANDAKLMDTSGAAALVPNKSLDGVIARVATATGKETVFTLDLSKYEEGDLFIVIVDNVKSAPAKTTAPVAPATRHKAAISLGDTDSDGKAVVPIEEDRAADAQDLDGVAITKYDGKFNQSYVISDIPNGYSATLINSKTGAVNTVKATVNEHIIFTGTWLTNGYDELIITTNLGVASNRVRLGSLQWDPVPNTTMVTTADVN